MTAKTHKQLSQYELHELFARRAANRVEQSSIRGEYEMYCRQDRRMMALEEEEKMIDYYWKKLAGAMTAAEVRKKLQVIGGGKNETPTT